MSLLARKVSVRWGPVMAADVFIGSSRLRASVEGGFLLSDGARR